MTKAFSDLRVKMSPESRERSEAIWLCFTSLYPIANTRFNLPFQRKPTPLELSGLSLKQNVLRFFNTT